MKTAKVIARFNVRSSRGILEDDALKALDSYFEKDYQVEDDFPLHAVVQLFEKDFPKGATADRIELSFI